MSNKAINYVLETSKTKGSARVLMIVIADMANDDGECWPGKARLEQKVNVTHRQLTYLVQDCERANELRVIYRSNESGDNDSNIYLIVGLASHARLVLARKLKPKYVRPAKGGAADSTTGGDAVDSTRGGAADSTTGDAVDSTRGSAADSTQTLSNPTHKPSDKPTTVDAPASTHAPAKKRAKAKVQPRSEVAPEPLYEAVEVHIFGTASDPTAPYAWKTQCGLIALWLMGRISRVRESEFGVISAPADPRHVEAFARWYRGRYQDASLPRDPVKFVSHWRAWASAQRPAAKPIAAPNPAPAHIDIGQVMDEWEKKRDQSHA